MAERRLSCHHHVNDSSRSRHVSRAFFLSSREALTATLTNCNLPRKVPSVVNLGCSYTRSLYWSCWPYLLFRSADYGKRAWRLFGIVFKQIRAQRRAALLQKDVVAVLLTSFGESLVVIGATIGTNQSERSKCSLDQSASRIWPMWLRWRHNAHIWS